MKLLVLCVVVVASLAFPAPAQALFSCGRNGGVAPPRGAEIPRRAQLVVFNTNKHAFELKGSAYVAKINNTIVPLTISKVKAGPYWMVLVRVQSDATGTLQLIVPFQTGSGNGAVENRTHRIATYTVVAEPTIPTEVNATPSWLSERIDHSTVTEEYDALALELDTKLAVRATIKLRRDAKGKWSNLVVPVTPPDDFRTKSSLRIGELGCDRNYTAALFERGVEIVAQVTLVDGSTRKLKLPSTITASQKLDNGKRELR